MTTNYKILKEAHVNENISNFWNMIHLYVFNQQFINRRIVSVIPTFAYKLVNENIDKSFLIKNLQEINNVSCLTEVLQLIDIQLKKCNIDELKSIIKSVVSDNNFKLFILVLKLLPKNSLNYNQQNAIVLFDFVENTTIFFNCDKNDNKCNVPFAYFISYKNSNLSIGICSDDKLSYDPNPNSIWLTEVLYPKLVKWIENCDEKKDREETITSLSLIDIEEYTDLYGRLKIKYGTEMVKIWPEKTDPAKFVYEDIAIATYLLLLWKQERSSSNTTKLQSFVDLGCGNGLLVYILSSEGHPGFGIDLRKRGIWDLYPKTTILKIESIIPSNKSIFPDIDWIIGNHSDELSPWVPVITARSSYKAKYFLLPCCAYEFDGKKYQRQNCKKSQYHDFLDYIVEISKECGFETLIDRLKIPSTKRICVIGNNRCYNSDDFLNYCEKIQTFINSKSLNTNSKESNQWNDDFKPREAVEKVRNCTKIDQNVITEIVDIVFKSLIATENYSSNFCNPNWNIGGQIPIPDLIKIIPVNKLQKLKSECGGLQTLLKNNHQIFDVRQGKVKIRLPVKLKDKMGTGKNEQKDSKKDFIFKQKPCWFFYHHPMGCPFVDKECSYKH